MEEEEMAVEEEEIVVEEVEEGVGLEKVVEEGV